MKYQYFDTLIIVLIYYKKKCTYFINIVSQIHSRISGKVYNPDSTMSTPASWHLTTMYWGCRVCQYIHRVHHVK